MKIKSKCLLSLSPYLEALNKKVFRVMNEKMFLQMMMVMM